MSEFQVDNPDIQPNAFETVAQVGAFQNGLQQQAAGPATSVASLNGLRGDVNLTAATAASGFQITISPSGTSDQLGISVASTITPTNISVSNNATVTKLLIQGVGTALTIAANTIAPTNSIHHVTNALLLKTITVPSGFTSGSIDIIPDAAFTYDATGNIVVPAGGGTAVINRTIRFTYDGSKWTPSY